MGKKRSIGAIALDQFASHKQVKFIRRRKNRELQVRKHRLTDQEHERLISLVNCRALRDEGLILVWTNGWSFYPNGVG